MLGVGRAQGQRGVQQLQDPEYEYRLFIPLHVDLGVRGLGQSG